MDKMAKLLIHKMVLKITTSNTPPTFILSVSVNLLVDGPNEKKK